MKSPAARPQPAPRPFIVDLFSFIRINPPTGKSPSPFAEAAGFTMPVPFITGAGVFQQAAFRDHFLLIQLIQLETGTSKYCNSIHPPARRTRSVRRLCLLPRFYICEIVAGSF